MILVDTSVWIDHLRVSDLALIRLLRQGEVLVHSFVIGELALGNLRARAEVLEALGRMPQAVRATDDEVMAFIEAHALQGLGVGYVDAHLLASARLTSNTKFWTRDRRLAGVAERIGVLTQPVA